MFEGLDKFDRILVTGPQRSGTRICAKMIAHDTGYEYIDEHEISTDSLYKLQSLFNNKRRFVIQCPALCRYIHMFSSEDTVIVLMRRNIESIIASQERIGWDSEHMELERYNRSDGVIAEVKYRFWEEDQRDRIRHTLELEYESLSGHPLWASKVMRRNFLPDQTEDLTIIPEARIRQGTRILYWEEPDKSEATLVNSKGSVKVINATGRLLWSMCDGTRTRQDLLDELKARFCDVEEDILERDLDKYINDLGVRGFLRIS
jgi:coenzyme PQQ synthesis protein D (PqqD)